MAASALATRHTGRIGIICSVHQRVVAPPRPRRAAARRRRTPISASSVRILADQRRVHAAALAGRAVGEDRAQPLEVATVDAEGAVGAHLPDELVGDRRDREHLLLVGADDVVVEGGAAHDVAPRLAEVGSLVDHYRRIAGPGADRALAARHRRLDDGRAAGDHQELDAGVAHDALRRLDGRLGNRAHQVGRSPGLDDGVVDELHGPVRAAARPRVGVEYDAVAGRDHADRVADHGRDRLVLGMIEPMTPYGAY
jgi:hypothetical protein